MMIYLIGARQWYWLEDESVIFVRTINQMVADDVFLNITA